MANCLGIYFDDNIVKYAKLIKNSAGTVEIKEHGIRFIKSTLKETLEKVISDTNSDKDVSIVINAPKLEYNPFQLFKQISSNDLQNVIKLEYEDLCEKNSVAPESFSYIYSLSSTIIGDYRRGIMGVSEKKLIEEYSKIGETEVVSMYPVDLLLPTTVPEEDKNYVLINLDKDSFVTTVLNGKVTYTSVYKTGMKQIIDKFIDVLGSYQKAYDACKQLNVFTDAESDSNKVQLEEIVEPILQDILRNVTEDMNRYKDVVTKIYITGMGILFTNIDTLFTEYYGIRCEILKPKFVTDAGGVRNIAETLEVLPAIALAREYLTPLTTDLEFIKKNVSKENFFDKLFGKIKNRPKKEESVEKKKNAIASKLDLSMLPKISINKISEYMMYPIIICFLGIISYYVFSNIFMNQITKMKADLSKATAKYDEVATTAKSDKATIDAAANKYKTINDQVNFNKQQIESEQIGKFRTYNVAAFTQVLMQIIPKNVQLKTISSDDNKKIVIVAQSDEYQNLGYFIANLRLQPDILTNVTVNKIENASVITIEIGGVLP